MTISTQKQVWTDEEFMALSKNGHRYELVNGELVDIGNSGMEHGEIGSCLGTTKNRWRYTPTQPASAAVAAS